MNLPRRFSEVSGFVLAGGASLRMGTDKASLLLGEKRLVDLQIHLMRAVCRSVAIIGPLARFGGAGVQVYEDTIPCQGPLGGIYTGLRRARTEFSLFLGCDMPLMEARFLRYLCRQARATPALATVPPPSAGGRFPICMVLRRRALAKVFSSLESGQNQVARFLLHTPRRAITGRSFDARDFPLASLLT